MRNFQLVLNEMGPGRTSRAWYFHNPGYMYHVPLYYSLVFVLYVLTYYFLLSFICSSFLSSLSFPSPVKPKKRKLRRKSECFNVSFSSLKRNLHHSHMISNIENIRRERKKIERSWCIVEFPDLLEVL